MFMCYTFNLYVPRYQVSTSLVRHDEESSTDIESLSPWALTGLLSGLYAPGVEGGGVVCGRPRPRRRTTVTGATGTDAI